MSDADASKSLNTFGNEGNPYAADVDAIDRSCQSVGEVAEAFRIVGEGRKPVRRGKKELVIGPAEEIPPGHRVLVDDGRQGIGVFNVEGSFYALRNVCPHLGAPLCRGKVGNTHGPGETHTFEQALDGRVLKCPWHGWEFDVVTGKGLYDAKGRVATFDCHVDDEGNVVVTTP